jgi:hypothetical protein
VLPIDLIVPTLAAIVRGELPAAAVETTRELAMTTNTTRSVGRALAYAGGVAAAAYGAYIGTTWLRFGRVRPAAGDERDPLLDRFMPVYEIAERHHINVGAPANISFAAACDVNLEGCAVVRAIFHGRALILGSKPDQSPRPSRLLDAVQRLGWRVLADDPGREIVLGAVTRPWDADVVFRSIPPEEFAAFDEPGYVKIAWTLRAAPARVGSSIVRTETRAVSTDRAARAKFRRYWSMFSPGIVLIRRMMLDEIKRDAERRARVLTAAARDRFSLASAGDLDPQC